MDGTLIDTEPYWIEAEHQLLALHGLTWSHEAAVELVGSGLWEAAAFFQRLGVPMGADEIVHWLTDNVRGQIETSGLPWRPGARELLRALRDRGTPTALVTMSLHTMAAEIAGHAGFTAFDVIVGGDDVARAKPAPDAYLKAAEMLGVDITHCVALEDSVPGLAAAIASGAAAISIPHLVEVDPTGAAALWSSLADTTPADLDAVFASHVNTTASVQVGATA